jgi:hypothetical protein
VDVFICFSKFSPWKIGCVLVLFYVFKLCNDIGGVGTTRTIFFVISFFTNEYRTLGLIAGIESTSLGSYCFWDNIQMVFF